TQTLQEMARLVGETLPQLIMIDQEGGTVTRFDFMTPLPSAMAIGAADSRSYAYIAGEICGKELRSLGINVNCAPVLDLLTNKENHCIGIRSFGSNPAKVADLGVQYINGLQSSDVMAVAKHFPGLGAASFDTHHGPARIDKSLEELDAFDLIPFRKAIEAGVAMVMATHAEYPSLPGDSAKPASLSSYILTDLLRNRLQFRGPSVSDDLSMGAISKRWKPNEAAIAAISAGADVLLFCHELEKIGDIHTSILKAVSERRLSAERVLEAATRVLWLKAELDARSKEDAGGSEQEVLDLEMHELNVYEIAENAISVVRDEDELLPIDTDTEILLIHPRLEDRFNLPPLEQKPTIGSAMAECFDNVTEVSYDRKGPSKAEMDDIEDAAEDAELIVLCTFSAAASSGQIELCKKVASLKKPCVLVALSEPFDVNLVDGFGTAIASFGFDGPSVNAIAAVLAGDAEPGGTMPVELG
ncbi:MAG: hypothetical protein JW941_12085, partial [Candidatus Coatesbacteria bacterium]|nr:hypothetical protein [Candidatus Coatesbacteria bacterium]